ncbi:MAG: hypothetical protein C0490_03280, partial [Marivirga sp.]|nr:hypothetical protein [Marivirga sp.]
WPGKIKVAMAVAGAVMCGAVIIQCNSKLEDQAIMAKIHAAHDFTLGVNLPVLPESGYRFNGDSTDALNVSIAGNKLTINGVNHELSEIVSVIEKGGVPSLSGHIVLRVDKDQKMKFVRDVHTELRKIDRRKLLYLAQTETGLKVESVILLPPTPDYAARNGMPEQPDISAVEAEGKTDILEIHLGDNAGMVNQQKVYDFVTTHLKRKSTNYVVAAKFDDDDTYQDYLMNLAYVKEGFHQLYQERAHEMFGKDYFTIDKEEYKAVRQGVPMAISISER